jgi:V-type H+-transporting ATPase 16kDa proteolipid subunit
MIARDCLALSPTPQPLILNRGYHGCLVSSNLTINIFCFRSGFLGSALCIILSNWGAAWGTWKSGLGICGMGVGHPNGIIKNLIAIIMAGVLGIYGLIVAIIIGNGVLAPAENVGNTYSQFTGWAHLAAGLCCGLTNLAAGAATGIAGEAGILSTGLRAQVNHAKVRARSFGGGSREITDEGDAAKLYIGEFPACGRQCDPEPCHCHSS